MSKIYTAVVIQEDGRRIKTHADGRVEELPPDPSYEALEHLYENADAPLTPERLAKFRPVPRVKRLRWSLSLSQQEFADRYHIPLGTLRDWEQGRTEPDATVRAYIEVIAKNPDMVWQALAT